MRAGAKGIHSQRLRMADLLMRLIWELWLGGMGLLAYGPPVPPPSSRRVYEKPQDFLIATGRILAESLSLAGSPQTGPPAE